MNWEHHSQNTVSVPYTNVDQANQVKYIYNTCSETKKYIIKVKITNHPMF